MLKMKLLRELDPWKKYGIIFSAFYCLLVILCLTGSSLGIGGGIFVWLLFLLILPAPWVSGIIGFGFLESTSFFLLFILNMLIFFVIGSFWGMLVSRFRG